MVESRSSRWTAQEDALFRRMAEANTRPEIIAAKLNRSVHAIKARAYTIGLPLKRFKLKAKGKCDASFRGLADRSIGRLLFGTKITTTANCWMG